MKKNKLLDRQSRAVIHQQWNAISSFSDRNYDLRCTRAD